MKSALLDGWKNVGKLVHFLVWYAIGLAAVFYLLPMAGRLIERHYDAMGSLAKIFTVVGFLALVALWQLRNRRDHGE